jgi:uncharacterized protein YjcR
MGISKKEEREYARMLFVNERITYKEIATRVGVGEKTISRWAKDDNWDKLRKSLLTTRQSQLVHWYNQLDAINEDIMERPLLLVKGKEVENPNKKGIPTNGEADTMSKITSNIQRLEVETNIGEYIEVGRKVLTFVQDINLEDAKLLKNYFDEFINAKLKNG